MPVARLPRRCRWFTQPRSNYGRTGELLAPTVEAAKVVLATQYGDSINRIAEKIGISYSWVYDWVDRLEQQEIISNTDTGIQIVDHSVRRRYDEIMATLYRREEVNQDDAYVIPHFAGMEFAFTEIDAAFVWTDSGFQIARSHDDFPVFIAVYDRDIERWADFFDRYGIHSTVGERPAADTVDGNVHYVLMPSVDGVETNWVDGNPVIPLDAAVTQMRENRAPYEPALEIIAAEHDVDIDATHQDHSYVRDELITQITRLASPPAERTREAAASEPDTFTEKPVRDLQTS